MKQRTNLQSLRHVSVRQPPFDRRWARLEKKLGFPLPDDYKELIDAHGGSTWQGVDEGDYVSILSPFARISWHSIFGLGQDLLDGYRAGFLAGDQERLPFTYAMEPGGLLPWLVTDGGDVGYLLIRGDGRHYPIVFQMSRAFHFEINYSVRCAEFAYRVASKTLKSGIR